MTTETFTATEILSRPAREIGPLVEGIGALDSLQALGAAERQGENRSGVLNLIQNRIGQVVMETGGAVSQPISPELMALLQASGEIVETTEDIFASDANRRLHEEGEHAIVRGTVTTRTARKVTVFVPTDMGYVPRLIKRAGLGQALKGGARTACPDCGRTDCCVDPRTGRFSGDWNACAGRPKRPFMRCPRCAKRFHDLLPTGQVAEREADAMEIASTTYAQVSPEKRIQARMDQHLLAYHPEEAAAFGIVPQNPRDRVAGAPAERVAP